MRRAYGTFLKVAMRLPLVCSTLFVAGGIAAMATSMPLQPIDPQILIDTGGDAMDITTGGVSITLSPSGGGIFVFHNATGGPLSKLDVSVQFPMPTFPSGFGVDGTIAIQQQGQQQTSFMSSLFPDMTCAGQSSSSVSCVLMVFGLIPGPLIGTNQNFVLDFDAKVNGAYVGVDALVATGQYTGGTDTSEAREGEWPDSASAVTVPVLSVPEPGTFGAILLCGAGLALYYRRQRSAR
jgi:hypothetical protein